MKSALQQIVFLLSDGQQDFCSADAQKKKRSGGWKRTQQGVVVDGPNGPGSRSHFGLGGLRPGRSCGQDRGGSCGLPVVPSRRRRLRRIW